MIVHPGKQKKPGYNFRAPLINLLRFICGLQNVAGNKSCDYTRKDLHEFFLQPTQKIQPFVYYNK
jgi:hypothetical protein